MNKKMYVLYLYYSLFLVHRFQRILTNFDESYPTLCVTSEEAKTNKAWLQVYHIEYEVGYKVIQVSLFYIKGD